MYRCPRKSEEGVRFFGAEVTRGYEVPSVGAGNWIQVLWKSGRYPEHRSHLSVFLGILILRVEGEEQVGRVDAGRAWEVFPGYSVSCVSLGATGWQFQPEPRL